jgi:hypothetical protein
MASDANAYDSTVGGLAELAMTAAAIEIDNIPPVGHVA